MQTRNPNAHTAPAFALTPLLNRPDRPSCQHTRPFAARRPPRAKAAGDGAANVGRRRVLAAALATALPLVLPPLAPGHSVGGDELRLSDDEWRQRLTRDQFRVMREMGTERPFSSPLNGEKRAGLFVCAGCAQPVYSSRTKFESGTGWPSFWDPMPGAVTLGPRTAKDLLFLRTDIRCSRCDGHLGHMFADGPKPTGKRYCMNGVTMRFIPDKVV